MALPKAILLCLGDYDAAAEEAQLRKSGFATGRIAWKELKEETNDWLQLAEVIADESVCAVAVAGETQDFTRQIYASVALLICSLPHHRHLATAFVQCDNKKWPPLPEALAHVTLHHSLEPFAAKLMAARFKKNDVQGKKAQLAQQIGHSQHLQQSRQSFGLTVHLDPFIGIWLELCPKEQAGFLIGVLDAEIIAFGTGKKGIIPATATLQFPLLGITGELGNQPFSACAAQNTIGNEISCFCKVSGLPTGVFLGDYPEDEQFGDVQVFRLA